MKGDLNVSESSEEEKPVRSSRSSGLYNYKAREWFNTEIMRNGFEMLVEAIFLKCIFEFNMINTAPQGSNSVNGREKYFNIHYKL